ncbi:MAG: enoyl-CoA hydratase [Candidatus Poriferisodalaceae bacterium]|jgi:enoyl-CoA hydratase
MSGIEPVIEVSEGPVRVSVKDKVATLTLYDPPMNPVARQTVEFLEDLVPRLAADDDVRVVVLSGEGSNFCSGANIKQFGEIESHEGQDHYVRRRVALIGAIEALPKPVIARMRGYALGGGLEFALGCHFRIADTTVKVGVPEVKLGTLPAWGGTQRLARTVPRDVALRMLMTGEFVPADRALALGLLTEVVDPEALEERVAEFSAQLAAGPSLAIAGALDAVLRGGPLPLSEGLEVEYQAIQASRGSDDHREGVRAFREKRPPQFG